MRGVDIVELKKLMMKGKNMRTSTTVYDAKCNLIFTGDNVSLFGMTGEVVFECGAYGIVFQETIDWDLIESKIPEVTGCDNTPCFCENDNFISFWELLWNFNCEEELCSVVEVVKKEGLN